MFIEMGPLEMLAARRVVRKPKGRGSVRARSLLGSARAGVGASHRRPDPPHKAVASIATQTTRSQSTLGPIALKCAIYYRVPGPFLHSNF
jgi:hypothetical protein